MNENDHTEKLQKSKVNLLVKVQVIIAVVAVIVTIVAALQIIPLIEKKESLDKEIKAKIVQLDSINNELKTLTPLAKKGLGYKPEKVTENTSIPKTSLQAVDAANQILSRSSSTRRSAVTIVVYTKNLEKEVNTNVVLPSLRELGFRIDTRTSGLQTVETNAIWFGSNVSIDDVKLVVYQLIGAGLPIKAIRPFRNPQAKANRIEIGGDAGIVNQPELTVEQIRNTTEFVRDEGSGNDYSTTSQ